MENASKALIMAAGILVGILVLSLAIYLFATFGTTLAEVNDAHALNQLAQFNEPYQNYDGKTNLTIYDVVSIANLAKSNNDYYGLPDGTDITENTLFVAVEYKFDQIHLYSEKEKNDLIMDDLDMKKYYTANVEISSVTNRVYRVEIKETRETR